ncbi:hypothetical protein MTR_8g468040 [Medicago truncatula]|uniref:Protein FAR1-RELATED SEQUENCE n=1 Tax=Medicago truncatula TaxID=3880 RepID=A0A072TRC5_MEDTR|nr:hypothetical protein MTR_8g468040 [Medicago truncatula]
MQCESSGQYKPPNTRKKSNLEGMGSRKYECPCRLQVKEVCEPYAKFVAYVETTVLNVKKKFVRAWTNKVLHLGCRTTNIIELAHAKLKKYLRSRVGDLASYWDEIDKMLAIQLGEIQENFGRSINFIEHKYKRHKLCSQFEGYESRAALGFMDDELACSRTFGFDKEDCGCVQKTSYELPCACIIVEKRKKKFPILLDKEWNVIEKRLKRAPYKMKLHIKEALRQLGLLEDTMLSPPPRKVVTKGAPKRVRPTPKSTSTGRIPSRWERVDSQNPNSQFSQPKIKVPKSKGARLGTYYRSQASTPPSKHFFEYPYITQMPMIMRPFIQEIVNVKGSGNYGFWVIARHMGMDDENHVLVCNALSNELKNHKSDYLSIFGSEKRYKYILDGLNSPTSSSGIALEDKWLTLPYMGHIIATCYNRVVGDLVFPKRDICETYFPIRGAPPFNPHSNIMCLGLIPGHFLHDFLKEGCSLPPPCGKWSNNNIGEAEKWHFAFTDIQVAFNVLMYKEAKPPKKPTNEHNSIICGTPTPEKSIQDFEVMEEDENYALLYI